jgi:hypothetical protein
MLCLIQCVCVAAELEGHLLPSGPLPCKGLAACPNGCDVKTRAVSGAVFASALQQHLERCPKQEVLCDLCNVKLVRSKLNEHLASAAGAHLSFLFDRVAKLEQDNALLKQKLEGKEVKRVRLLALALA